MIYVRIELWPHGDRAAARLLGEGIIANVTRRRIRDGEREGLSGAHDYEVRLMKSPEYAKAENLGQVWRKGMVYGFPRRRLGPWDLLLRALAATIAKRNPEAAAAVVES